MSDLLIQAISQVFVFKVIMLIGIGTVSGILVGAIPGLTVTMATAILVSFTYGWSLLEALALIMGVFVGGVYGGCQSAILVNIPGAPAAISTAFDGFPLSQRGEAGRAIGIATSQSFLGGLIGTGVLAILAPPISHFALRFGSFEYFLLGIFGLTTISRLASKSLIKGLLSACFGIFIAMIGVDPVYGVCGRFTYGNTQLMGGVHFVAALIGLFGLSEVLAQIKLAQFKAIIPKAVGVMPKWSDMKRYFSLTIRSSFIGVFIGALPGVGGDIASLVAYDNAKRTVKNPSRPFGEGAYEGVVAPETANNACVGGALIPALTLGIPGDAVSALVLASFFLHGLRPGPLMMVHNPDSFWAIIIMSIIANVFMLIFGLSLSKVFSYVVAIPKNILMPIIVVLCVIGSYAIEGNIFHVWAMVLLGLIGWIMRRFDYSVGAMVLGIILGPIIDQNLRRSLVLSEGNIIAAIVGRPISLVLFVIIIVLIISEIPIVKLFWYKIFSGLSKKTHS
jgi:putative tricarboxylic transport membrane protein